MYGIAEILPVPGTPVVVARLLAGGLAFRISAVVLPGPVVLARDEKSFAVLAVEKRGSLLDHKSLHHRWLIPAKKAGNIPHEGVVEQKSGGMRGRIGRTMGDVVPSRNNQELRGDLRQIKLEWKGYSLSCQIKKAIESERLNGVYKFEKKKSGDFTLIRLIPL